MTAPPRSTVTKDKIIDAAMAIVREQGVAKLTLDAAAKLAQVSKGGVLYHFKSKDDLIRAMVSRLIESCDALHLEHYEREPEGPYRWARTVVHTTFDPRGPSDDPINSALLAAVSVNPDLLAPIHAKFAEWIERVRSDSPDPARAALICMAMDGYIFERMLKLPICDQEACDQIKRAALDLLK